MKKSIHLFLSQVICLSAVLMLLFSQIIDHLTFRLLVSTLVWSLIKAVIFSLISTGLLSLAIAIIGKFTQKISSQTIVAYLLAFFPIILIIWYFELVIVFQDRDINWLSIIFAVGFCLLVFYLFLDLADPLVKNDSETAPDAPPK